MLKITIEYRDKQAEIEWDGDAKEAEAVWARCEELAADQGHEPGEVAGETLALITKVGMSKNGTVARGQAMWAVYAVLVQVAANLDLASMADEARAALPRAPTIFDIAEHQSLEATIRAQSAKTLTIELSGRSPLDS